MCITRPLQMFVQVAYHKGQLKEQTGTEVQPVFYLPVCVPGVGLCLLIRSHLFSYFHTELAVALGVAEAGVSTLQFRGLGTPALKGWDEHLRQASHIWPWT